MPWIDPNDTYRKGDPWQIDQRSGFKVRMTDTKVEWTGLRVEEPDIRNGQDCARSKKASPQRPNPSPEPPSSFLTSPVTADDF